MRTTVGEDLQRLFVRREQGLIDEPAFQLRKAELLDWSRCRLTRFTPRRLRMPV